MPLTENGNSYVLVASDYFTRWAEAYPLPNQEAETVARKLTQEFFFRFSVPEQLHSDQGRQFESQLIAEVCKLLKINKTRTTPYHPQGDGLVERFNRTLLDMLATTVKDHKGTWEDHIRAVCMAYNTSGQHTTGYTPFFLIYGRQARIPVDLMFNPDSAGEIPHHEYAALLKNALEDAYSCVREKLHHPWSGPYQVVKRLSDVTYRIRNMKARHKRQVVHFDRLKPCLAANRRVEDTTTSSKDPPPP